MCPNLLFSHPAILEGVLVDAIAGIDVMHRDAHYAVNRFLTNILNCGIQPGETYSQFKPTLDVLVDKHGQSLANAVTNSMATSPNRSKTKLVSEVLHSMLSFDSAKFRIALQNSLTALPTELDEAKGTFLNHIASSTMEKDHRDAVLEFHRQCKPLRLQ